MDSDIFMTIDSETSHKISRLQWICCLLVVLQHSVPNVNESIVCNIVAGCLTRVAVPFFFVLSGLLYFKSFSPSIAFAWNKVCSTSSCDNFWRPWLDYV